MVRLPACFPATPPLSYTAEPCDAADYGRTYAGNPLNSSNELFTSCWNNTLVRIPSTSCCAEAYVQVLTHL